MYYESEIEATMLYSFTAVKNFCSSTPLLMPPMRQLPDLFLWLRADRTYESIRLCVFICISQRRRWRYKCNSCPVYFSYFGSLPGPRLWVKNLRPLSVPKKTLTQIVGFWKGESVSYNLASILLTLIMGTSFWLFGDFKKIR